MYGKLLPANSQPKIGLVGVCAAGKTTLAKELTTLGYNVRPIAQEHSYVPYMWQRITNPDILIYLDVSYKTTIQRKQLNWTVREYEEQQYRLRHAREHASIIIDTTNLTISQAVQAVVDYIDPLIK